MQDDPTAQSRRFERRLLSLAIFWGVALGLLLPWNLSTFFKGRFAYWAYGLSGGLAALIVAWFLARRLLRPDQKLVEISILAAIALRARSLGLGRSLLVLCLVVWVETWVNVAAISLWFPWR